MYPQDKNVWLSLVAMLNKKDKLPVVAFTFSRKRCDDNADSLTSLDLTSSDEKHKISVFFKKSISLLKGTDRQLPQVSKERGISLCFVFLYLLLLFLLLLFWLLCLLPPPPPLPPSLPPPPPPPQVLWMQDILKRGVAVHHSGILPIIKEV